MIFIRLGTCVPLITSTFICQCLGQSYSGQHCEIVTSQTMSKSFAFIALLAVSSVILFFIIMDILKYWFGVDPVDRELNRRRWEKMILKRKKAKRKKLVLAIHFIYLDE